MCNLNSDVFCRKKQKLTVMNYIYFVIHNTKNKTIGSKGREFVCVCVCVFGKKRASEG